MQLELSDSMVTALLNILGEMPAKTVVWLVNEISRQKAAHDAGDWEIKFGDAQKAQTTRDLEAVTVGTPMQLTLPLDAPVP